MKTCKEVSSSKVSQMGEESKTKLFWKFIYFQLFLEDKKEGHWYIGKLTKIIILYKLL